ncbi:hypothetical protein AOQ84DRAFT_80151 [Glonium stellatum]|uniref:Uncharacterized protein n=1 Tax=Glonium stellatum TaxID=574774 RepID=A0A8E2EXD8_9PEZI|nr:hypothetical protein AOQ84DRAFT_80151 [Glonium stellatum]
MGGSMNSRSRRSLPAPLTTATILRCLDGGGGRDGVRSCMLRGLRRVATGLGVGGRGRIRMIGEEAVRWRRRGVGLRLLGLCGSLCICIGASEWVDVWMHSYVGVWVL